MILHRTASLRMLRFFAVVLCCSVARVRAAEPPASLTGSTGSTGSNSPGSADTGAAGLSRTGSTLDLANDDPVFEKYVDFGRLADAWDRRDAAGIADGGLQLAEGERILLRRHHGVTAEAVLKLAARVAADRGDAETLERLARAGEQLKIAGLAEQTGAAGKLAGTGRGDAPPADPLGDVSLETLAEYKSHIAAIDAARLSHDREGLKKLIDSSTDLVMPGEWRERLVRTATAALNAIPADAKADATGTVLAKLGADAREGAPDGVDRLRGVSRDVPYTMNDPQGPPDNVFVVNPTNKTWTFEIRNKYSLQTVHLRPGKRFGVYAGTRAPYTISFGNSVGQIRHVSVVPNTTYRFISSYGGHGVEMNWSPVR